MKKIVFLLLLSFCFILLAANEDAKYPEEVQDALKYCEKMGYECEIGEFTNEEPKDEDVLTFDDLESFGLDIFENSSKSSSAPTCSLYKPWPSYNRWNVHGYYLDSYPYGYAFEYAKCAYNMDCVQPLMFNNPDWTGSVTSGGSYTSLDIQNNLSNGICNYGPYTEYYRVKEYAWVWVPRWPSGGFWMRIYSAEVWTYCHTQEICAYTGY